MNRKTKRLVVEKNVIGESSRHSAPPSVHVNSGKQRKISMDSFLPKHRGTRILTCGTGAQIGHGERETTLKPRKIDTLPNDVVFVQVCAGGVHTMILADDGRIWSCGFNDKGTVPTKHAQKDEAVNEMDLIEIPHSLHRHGKVVLLAAGSSFSAALTEKGSVIVWGNFRDPSGFIEAHDILQQMQLHPTLLISHDDVKCVKIVAGHNHLVILTETGQLMTIGDGAQGQLGRSARADLIRTSRVINKSPSALVCRVTARAANGRLSILSFVDVWAGGFWTIAKVNGSGDIYACGSNNYGQLGVEMNGLTDEEENDVVDGGTESASAIPDTVDLRLLTPKLSTKFSSDKNWTEFVGYHHVIARRDNGEVYGIGRNQENLLGLGSWQQKSATNPIEQNWRYTDLQRLSWVPDDVIGITANIGCTMIWTAKGDALGCGYDSCGQLGLGLKEEEDKMVAEPMRITSAHLDGYRIVQASIADDHCVFLAAEQNAA